MENNASYAAGFDKGELPAEPAKGIAVLTCMDARIDVHRILGVEEGDVHVIRNAGGLASQDAVRSLLLSQRVLGTQVVLVIQHTQCGMLNLPEDEVLREVEEEFGARPGFELGAFEDLHASVRAAVATVKGTPFLSDSVRGFVYDVATGRLNEII